MRAKSTCISFLRAPSTSVIDRQRHHCMRVMCPQMMHMHESICMHMYMYRMQTHTYVALMFCEQVCYVCVSIMSFWCCLTITNMFCRVVLWFVLRVLFVRCGATLRVCGFCVCKTEHAVSSRQHIRFNDASISFLAASFSALIFPRPPFQKLKKLICAGCCALASEVDLYFVPARALDERHRPPAPSLHESHVPPNDAYA